MTETIGEGEGPKEGWSMTLRVCEGLRVCED